jgi:hypothetical protein
MKDTAHEIRITVDDALSLLSLMKPEVVSSKPSPDKWSKKEMLGHLIDSASNNHQRFVRACTHAAAAFPPYNQNEWVRIQRYNELDWTGLVVLWSAYNRHLSHVIERIPDDALTSPCNLGHEEPAPLEFVIRDYLRHLRHHVSIILEREA